MLSFRLVPALLLVSSALVSAQDPGQVQLRIEPANRTLTVSGEGEASVEPEIAVLRIGFETQLGDAQGVYADGARTSNAIIAALKQAGIPESAIRSEFQRLDRDYTKPHKFKLIQQWTVRAPAGHAAEILDAAITAGATSSGDIEWTVKDEQALAHQALEQAAERARANAEVLARGMGVRLGALIYVSNQPGAQILPRMNAFAMAKEASAPPLAIEPNTVTRTASVRAIYAIE
jgi:uncharacterized protein YggE